MFRCPDDRRCIPAIFDAVRELIGNLGGDGRGARLTVQNGDQHAARQRAVRCEAGADAVHKTRVKRVLDSLQIPVGGLDIRVDGDAACGLCVFFTDGAAELGLDVGKDSLRVGHGRVAGLENLGVLEHREAVAAVGNGVVDAAEGVCLLQIERLIQAGLLVQNLHVADAVVARDLDELALVVGLNRGRNAGKNGVLQTRNAEEAAGFLRILHCTHLEHIENGLAGHFHLAWEVAPREDGEHIVEGDVAFMDGLAQAAAVHDADVGVHHDAERIRCEIAERGLRVADKALVAIVVGQLHVALGYDLRDAFFERVQDVLDVSVDGFVLHGNILGGNELRGDRAVFLDGELTDGGELTVCLTGLGEDDLLAVLVGDLHGEGLVVMAVEHSVDACSIGNDRLGRPDVGDAFIAEVGKGDDIVGAGLLDLVDGVLYGLIQRRTVIVFAEGINVVAVFVLEVCGGGLGEGLRRGNADVSDLRSAVIDDLVRLVGDVGLAGAEEFEVAGEVFVLGLLRQLGKLRELVVELMVAEGRKIVAGLVHDVDDVSAGRKGADSLALNRVAAVDQRHVVVGLLHFGFVCRNASIAHAIGYAAVNVVGVQDDNVVGFCVCRECRGPETQNHYQAKQKCK